MNERIIYNLEILRKYHKSQNSTWRASAYSKAITTLSNLGFEISDIKQVKGLRFVGPKITTKIDEFLKTGKIAEVEKTKPLLKKEPAKTKSELDIEKLQLVWGIGPKKAEELVELGMNTVTKLRKNPILLNKKQKIGIKYYEDLLKKIPRIMIHVINVFTLIQLNRKWGKDSYQFKIAGSYRRGKKESGDIDMLVSSEEFKLRDLVNLLEEKKLIVVNESMKNEKFMGIIKCPTGYGNFMRLDIQFIPKESWGSALLYFTGSKNTNLHMRSKAKKMGLVLNQRGLFKNGKKLKASTEKEIFSHLGIKYLEPHKR